MLGLDNIFLRYGDRTIFDGISANIGPRDRIGLVGSNGAGKTTLLRLLTGQESPEDGAVEKAKYITVGYLPQDGLEVAGKTLYAEVETAFDDILQVQANIDDANKRLGQLDPATEEYRETLVLIGEWEHRLEDLEAHRLKSKIEKVLLGLGFSLDDMQRDTQEFSGGWQMRIALAKLLLREPSLLLLDEPTNHLDLDSLRWLETFLKNYDGALILVSHDRAFLDNLCNRTFALSLGRLETYAGNYSFFEKESTARKVLRLQAFKNQQRQLAQTERFIERFRYKNTKARQVQSRIKALDKIDRVEIEQEEEQIQFSFSPAPRSGRVVLTLEDMHKAYGDLKVFENFDLELERGDRVAVVGVNGAGKSTLTRILAGVEPLSAGTRTVGHNAALSYFAQHQAGELDPEKQVLEIAAEGKPVDERSRLRTLLGAFLFRGDDVFKKVSVLSGGEKNRLALAKMLLQPANLLILDEPTNHLDMRSKAVLQQALREYSGTFIIVSHDRAFLDPIVDKVLEIRKDGTRMFPGTVSEYIIKVEEEEAAKDQTRKSTSPKKESSNGISSKELRRLKAAQRERLAPLRNKAQKLEKKINSLEEKIKAFETEMADPVFFKRGETTNEQLKEYDALKRRLERAYHEWEQTTESLAQQEESILTS